MKVWGIIIFCVCMVWGTDTIAYAEEQVKMGQAVQGVLHLPAASEEADEQVVYLNGEWELYWQELLEPTDLSPQNKSGHSLSYIHVPSIWGKNELNGKELPNQGYATYRLIIDWQAGQLPTNQMALYMPSVASAYKLWINGELRASNGIVGSSLDEMEPKNYAKVVPFTIQGDRLEIVIQVSNFVQRKGGLWETIRIGAQEQITRIHEQNMARDFFIFGGMMMMGIYHLVLFMLRRKDRSTLYFGLVCLLIGTRSMFVGDGLLVQLFPQIPWELGVKLEYWTSGCAIMFLSFFVYSLYPGEAKRQVLYISAGLCLVNTLYVMLTPAIIYTQTMLVSQIILLTLIGYLIYVFIIAAIRKREGANTNCFVMLVFFLSVLNEVLYYNQVRVLPIGETISFGLYIYLFGQAVILSVRYSRSFKQSEQLASELASLNTSLEEKVKDRTAKLEKMDLSRRMLLSNITHELRTPLTSILGYIKGMLDGIIPLSPTYANNIYQKGLMLNRIIQDLSELSRLESGQAKFNYRNIPIINYVEQIYEKYVFDMKENELEFELVKLVHEIPANCHLVSYIDEVRIEQVLSNLLMNAKKFTPSGGLITLLIEYEPHAKHVTIIVKDTGIGISEEDMTQIFERLFRSSAARKKNVIGTGIGLVIAKEIVELHGGTIACKSVEGMGSTFYFTLPVRLVSNLEKSGDS
ncbi:hypothetical protein E0485_09415 [Paenibacillus albiflavus]|uniref:histidine kinase n=1 Tax=Paenibacillus albiflavus TaxID=2545760 RepID=A0A4V2WP24_9BACL|nr:ATP-binding protein [Paenibacillus albiflavus]TCZ77692.1 hypothetical protein E0485_09415 [Paenibacillus albiflavus]